MSATKKLYYFYHTAVEGFIFVDENAKFLSWTYDMDPENFEFIAIHFGGAMVRIFEPYMVTEDPADDLQDTGFVQDDEIKEWLNTSADLILEAIRQTEADNNAPTLEAEEEEFQEAEIVNHVGPVTDAAVEREQEEAQQNEMAADRILATTNAVQTEGKTMKKKSSNKKYAKKSSAPATPAKSFPKKKASSKKTSAKKYTAKYTTKKVAGGVKFTPAKTASKKSTATAKAKKTAPKAKPAKKAPTKKPAKGGSKKKK